MEDLSFVSTKALIDELTRRHEINIVIYEPRRRDKLVVSVKTKELNGETERVVYTRAKLKKILHHVEHYLVNDI